MARKKITLAISMLFSMSAFSHLAFGDNNDQIACACTNENKQSVLDVNKESCSFYNRLSDEEKAAFDTFIRDLINLDAVKEFESLKSEYTTILEKYRAFTGAESVMGTITATHSILESTENLNIIPVTEESNLLLKDFFKTLTDEELSQVEALLNKLSNSCKEFTKQLDTLFTSESFEAIKQAVRNNNKIVKFEITFEQQPSLIKYAYQTVIS